MRSWRTDLGIATIPRWFAAKRVSATIWPCKERLFAPPTGVSSASFLHVGDRETFALPHAGDGIWISINFSIIIRRSEEHTSELQSLMRISYAVFCLKKKKNKQNQK